MSDPSHRWAWAEVDLGAVAHNVRVVAREAGVPVWAVVKADGYGHGSVPVARAALDAGAAGLCVALVQEGAVLRAAGIEAPILLLSEQPAAQATDIVRLGLIATIASAAGVRALASAAEEAATEVRQPVQLKIDTGMHRMGCDPVEAVAIARLIAAQPSLQHIGTFTHLATADDPGHPAVSVQLDRFDAALDALRAAGIDPGVVHAANSAGALAIAQARRDLVRVGIALYGIEPGAGVADRCGDLRPAMSVRARVSRVHRVAAGEGVSYGHRFVASHDTTVATVPIGYADGVARRSFACGVEVLIGGRRHPIVGVVTMDQLMVDVDEHDVRPGDEVVLIGAQGDDAITATEVADRLGTIGYEVVCAVSQRVPRRHS